jgi:hypothetical protein
MPMNCSAHCQASRRSFLRSVTSGLGAIALTAMTRTVESAETRNPLVPKPPHFEPRAKRVLMLCMEGGPSHVDTFDYKPELARREGRSIGKGRVPFANVMASPWQFRQEGEAGLWISDLFPELRRQADRLCLLNGMQTDIPAHPPAFLQLHTGISNAPRPSMGAWILYGLGTENANLPGFVTISAPANNGGPANYGSAFLPAAYQGTRIGGGRLPVAQARVANLKNLQRSARSQAEQLAFVRKLNGAARQDELHQPFVEGLIEAHELAHEPG